MIKTYTIKYWYKGIFHCYNTASLKHALRKFERLDRNRKVKKLEMETVYED